MIIDVSFQNFKCLKDVNCSLGRFNVIVGPNSCGKSSFLECLDLLSQLTRDSTSSRVDALFSDSNKLDFVYSGDGDESLRLSCSSFDAFFNFVASKHPDASLQSLTHNHGWSVSLLGSRRSIKESSLYYCLNPLLYVRFDAYRMTLPTYSDDAVPRVLQTGEGLASAVANLITNRPEQFDSLLARMIKLIPHLKRIRTERRRAKSQSGTLMGDYLVFDFANRTGVPCHNVSEGTLFSLAILVILHSEASPNLLLIDDIERGLHPLAQRKMVELLRELLEANSDLQIVATCHSPYFLDFLSFDEVKVTTLNTDGYSIIGTLKDHPEFEKWKEELTPGEMWTLFGEKWLAEPNDE